MATLESMVGRVMRARPGLDRSLAIDFLNERLRSILNRNPNWAGLTARTVIPIPTAYAAGTVTLTTGSRQVVGTGTNWPIDDAFSGTLATQIPVPGNTRVQLSSVAGLQRGTLIVLDGNGPNTEALPILQILSGANVVEISPRYPHDQNATVTVSSLAGQQMRFNAFSPIFTVQAVLDPSTITLDPMWGDQSSSGNGYQILRMYTTVASDVDSLQLVYDPVQSMALRLNVRQEELNSYDPNRQATDSPTCISPIGPQAGGLMLYEIYPAQSTARQLAVLYRRKWPNMVLPSDTQPPFINENALVFGALADAFITPCPRGPEGKDPGFNPQASQMYEARFEQAYIDALTADQSKVQSNFTYDIGRTLGPSMGSQWNVDHDWDSAAGNY